jgi:hypothetical protein
VLKKHIKSANDEGVTCMLSQARPDRYRHCGARSHQQIHKVMLISQTSAALHATRSSSHADMANHSRIQSSPVGPGVVHLVPAVNPSKLEGTNHSEDMESYGICP